ncbi:MAG TPA: PAS-domain containing protein [Stellaceae bacterium]|nr:PAS-domain containing protein [Stellaceae bacterium]
MIEVASIICLVAAAAFAVAWQLARRRGQTVEANRAAVAALLNAAPFAVFCWRGRGPEAVFGRLRQGDASLSYAGFLASLAPDDASRLADAVGELQRDGTPFVASVTGTSGAAHAIEGRRTADGSSVVWLTDAAATRRAERAREAATADAAAVRGVLDRLPVAVWRRDPSLRLADCNSAYAAMLEMPRAAVLALRGDAAADAGRDAGMALARAAVAASAPRSERRHIVIAGARRLLEFTEIPDSAGGTTGFALDLTELETAESELSRHANAHGQVLESIDAAVAIYGADKRLSFANSAFARLWGLEEEWLSGEPGIDELLERLRERRRVPEYADFRAFKQQQIGLFNSLLQPQGELMHLPDGRTLSTTVSPHPMGGLIFVYEDVTDRLALERSYNTLVEVERETLDNLFEGIAVFGSDGRLKLHNPAYRAIWGLSEADVDAEPRFDEIVDKSRGFAEDDGAWPAMREQIIARIGGQSHWHGQVERRDGSALQLATVPLPDGNVLFTCLDVTDTVRVARALRERNEALETADRLKSEFIANVSYELRTPLNAVIGFAEILSNQYFGALSPRQLEYSRGILDGSQRLMTLINDILDLATIEAGYMALESGRVEVCDLLAAVITLTRERARTRNVSLAMTCPAEVGAIDGDERRLKQALFNLVSNAIKFTPPGGSVHVQARLDGRRRGGDLILAVSDTGIGIAPSDHARMFEKFERGSRQTGAGLGLSLVKSLIELHGGTVAIDSGPGEGTTISCRLPARRHHAAASRATQRAV